MPFEQPLARVSIGGAFVPGVVDLRVDTAGYLAAGRFRVTLALNSGPGFGAAYFAALTNQAVQIDVAPNGFGFETLMLGRVDSVRIDWVRNTATILGRDLTGVLIDSETSGSFVNQTASEIASAIAARHQFGANIMATQSLVGQYYQLDHAQISLGLNSRVVTEWELLTALAIGEGFAVSVSGNILNFGLLPQIKPRLVVPGSFSALSFDSTTALPGAATVKSWNCRTKAVVAETQGSGLGTTIIRPNLTPSQAQKVATGHLELLAQHQLILQGSMPGDVTLFPGAILVLSGTGSVLDQSYLVDAVTRTLTEKSGFSQIIRAHTMTANP